MKKYRVMELAMNFSRNRENGNFLPGLLMYFQVDNGKKIFQVLIELRLSSM